MLEVKLILKDVAFEEFALVCLPIVRDILEKSDTEIAKFLVNHVPQTAIEGAIKGFLQGINDKAKELFVADAIALYQNQIIEFTQKTITNQGIILTLDNLTCKAI